jgi:hypothetical protein
LKLTPLSDAAAFFLYLRMQNKETKRAQSPSTAKETPTPMAALTPVLRPPVLGVWDDVGETVGPVLVANDSILEEELAVEDGAKIYPLSWTPKTLAPSDEMVALAVCRLEVKSM